MSENGQSALEDDEVVSDFVEACGGLASMNNITMIYRIIALINAEKNVTEEGEMYEDSNSYDQESQFFDELRNTLVVDDSTNNEPNVVSGYLYSQTEEGLWEKMLTVVQKGVIKCYDSDRKWRQSYLLKHYTHKMTHENMIYLISSDVKNQAELIFENREDTILTETKWTKCILEHIQYANSLPTEVVEEIARKVENRRSSIMSPSARVAAQTLDTPELSSAVTLSAANSKGKLSKVLSELSAYLIALLQKGIQESSNEEYKLGLKAALGKIYQSDNKFIQAEALYIEVLEGRKQLLGHDNFFTLDSMDGLVDLYCMSKEYQKAVPILEEIWKMRIARLGNAHPSTLVCMNNLAFLHERLGESTRSELLYRECCELYVSQYGTANQQSLIAMKNLAHLFYKHQKYDFAEEVFRGCFEQQVELLGVDHKESFSLMRSLVNVYLQQGKIDQIREMYPYAQDCLRIREEKLGVEHAASISALNITAYLAMKLGNFEEAEKKYNEVIKFRRIKLGVSHPETLSVINNLGTLYYNQQKYQKALPLFQDHLEQYRKVINDGRASRDSPRLLMNCLSNLANTFYYSHDYDSAEPLFVELIDMIKAEENAEINRMSAGQVKHANFEDSYKVKINFDINSLLVAAAYTNLANIYFRKQQYQLAQHLYEHSLDIRKANLGDHNAETLSSMKNLGVLYMTMKKNEDATELFKQCYEGRLSLLGQSHPDTLLAMSYLGNIYNARQMFDEARLIYIEFLDLVRDKPIDDTAIVIMNNLGIIHYRSKNYDSAEPLLKTVAEYKKEQFGPDNPNTLFCLTNLAVVYKAKKDYAEAAVLYHELYEGRKKVQGEDHADTKAALSTWTALKEALE